MRDSIITTQFQKFDSILINDENIKDFSVVIKKYFKNPKHIVINFSICETPSDSFLETLNFFALILKSSSYSLQVFSLSKKLLTKLAGHKFRNILVILDLANYISLLDKIEREIRVKSLLKSYVDETLIHFFNQLELIVKRSELTIEKTPTTFLNPINYFQTFELENGFFSFVIGGDELFFNSLIEKFNLKELAPIFSKITETISPELLEKVKLHNFLAHPYSNFPTEKLHHNGKDYPYFLNSNVMRIPLSCDLGDFYLEVWFPLQFASVVLKFLNP